MKNLTLKIKQKKYNFDITADWKNGDINFPVTNKESFESFLANRNNNDKNNLTDIVITDFKLKRNRLQCNVTANGNVLDLGDINIYHDNLKIGNLPELEFLYLRGSLIHEIKLNTTQYPALKYIDLNSSQIKNLSKLKISNNLQLETLLLANNKIIDISKLLLQNNKKLTEVMLGDNQFTTEYYQSQECLNWANTLPIFENSCRMFFSYSTNILVGTELENILTNKNCNVVS